MLQIAGDFTADGAGEKFPRMPANTTDETREADYLPSIYQCLKADILQGHGLVRVPLIFYHESLKLFCGCLQVSLPVLSSPVFALNTHGETDSTRPATSY